jgi:hypothetical protein
VGIDDILRDKERRRAEEQQSAMEGPARAQTRRNEAHKVLTDELLAAILALDDNALGNVSATPLSVVPGSNKRTVQIEGRGRVRTVFKTVVECAPEDPWATYTPVEVRVAIGEPAGTVRTGTVPGTGGQLVPDGGGVVHVKIDPENLRRTLHRLVAEL